MKTSTILKSLTLFPALLFCTLSIAQDKTSSGDSESKSGSLEEVMVTATRRGETNLQTTPIAVTAVQSKDIDKMVANDLGDLAAMVPNFSAAHVTGFNAASFSIRGIGLNSIIVYLDPPVGVTVDGMVIPSVQGQLLDTFDMASVEVLRGPQGTTFGKNTTGGVVNITTKRPQLGERFGEVKLRYGDYNDKKINAALNFAASDTLAFRFVGSWRDFSGYSRNGATYGPVDPYGYFQVVPGLTGTTGQGDGSHASGIKYFTGRFKMLWQPNDKFSAYLQYEIIRDRSDSPAPDNLTPNDPRFVFALLGFVEDQGDPLKHVGLSNRHRELLKMDDGHRQDVDGYYLSMDYDLGFATINSFTGYREHKSRLPSSYAGEVITLFDATRDDNRKTFQQELRLTSNAKSGNTWVLGAFYQTNDDRFTVDQVLGFLDFFGLASDPRFFDNTPQVLSNRQNATAWALFADANFDLTDRWHLGVGARYTVERKNWAGRHQIPIQMLSGTFDPSFTWEQLGQPLNAANFKRFPFGVVRDYHSWDELTYRATLGFDVNDDIYDYATFSHGFRSGGYNDQLGTSGIPIDPKLAKPYNPEKADSLELGMKTTLFDDRLRFNTALFYVKYDDAIQSVVQTLTNAEGATFQETRFFNAAKMTVKGVEVEANWLLTPNFVIRGNVGYIDAKYDRFQVDTNGDGIPDQDLSGLDLVRTPKWQWYVDGTYTQGLSSGNLVFNTSVSYEDKNIHTYSDVSPEFNTILDSKTLWDANLTYNSADNNWWVRAYIKNITDERYKISAQPVANLWIFGFYGPPRNYGLEAGFHFDM